MLTKQLCLRKSFVGVVIYGRVCLDEVGLVEIKTFLIIEFCGSSLVRGDFMWLIPVTVMVGSSRYY